MSFQGLAKLGAGLKAPTAGTTPLSRSERDLELWRAWKAAPTDYNLSQLLRQVDPLIQSETNKWAGTLARPLLEAEGKRLAVMAFQNFDPNKGAALGTHVSNYLMKMSRLSYANQNVARLPENKMLQFHTYRIGHAELTDQFGRPPTTAELSDHLGWSMPKMKSFQKDISRQELLESGGSAFQGGPDDGPSGPTFEVEKADHTVDFIHHDLAPQQQAIFEHLTGYGGKPILSNQQIMKQLKMTQGQYSYQKRLLVDHIDNVMKGR